MRNYKHVTRYLTADGKEFISPRDANAHVKDAILEAITDILRKTRIPASDYISVTETIYENREKLRDVLELENSFDDERDD